MNWAALEKMPRVEAFRQIWLRADDELERAFTNSTYWTQKWFDSEGVEREEVFRLLLRATDIVEHAYEQWDLAFTAYQHVKEGRP